MEAGFNDMGVSAPRRIRKLNVLDRVRDRSIAADPLSLLTTWPDDQPEIASEKWHKRFPEPTTTAKAIDRE